MLREELVRRIGAFERPHLTVLAILAVIGVVVAVGIALRARPVPLASAATASEPSASSATGAASPYSAGSPYPTGSAGSPGGPTPASTPSVPTIVVHVIGAVHHPGLVTLPEGSRVADAIDAAGGTTAKARLGELNLAQVLADGQQIVVGHDDVVSEVRGPGVVAGTGTAATVGTSAPIDLNTATVEQLEQLPGVGPVTAAAIIAWRTQHGRFTNVAELQEVDGIGPKTYARLAPLVRV